MATVKDIDRGWKRIMREVELMKGSHVNVGVLSDAPKAEGDLNMARLATIQHFGASIKVTDKMRAWFHFQDVHLSRGKTTINIPARPFMSQAFDKNIDAIHRFTQRRQDAIYGGSADTRSALNDIGVFFVGKVQDIFTSGNFVPNAPLTRLLKKSTRPLIDSGRLASSIKHEVIIK